MLEIVLSVSLKLNIQTGPWLPRCSPDDYQPYTSGQFSAGGPVLCQRAKWSNPSRTVHWGPLLRVCVLASLWSPCALRRSSALSNLTNLSLFNMLWLPLHTYPTFLSSLNNGTIKASPSSPSQSLVKVIVIRHSAVGCVLLRLWDCFRWGGTLGPRGGSADALAWSSTPPYSFVYE